MLHQLPLFQQLGAAQNILIAGAIVSALDGGFGNVHRTRRTDDSRLGSIH